MLSAPATVHAGQAHGARPWWEALSAFYGEHWKSVFFSVALAVVLDKLQVLTVLSKLSLTLVANLVAQSDAVPVAVQPGAAAVVVVSQADFHERYGEKSPLDRCLLAQDIGRVLEKDPRVLGIDVDLAPLVSASDSEKACQERLDTLLDANARRLVLLVPFPTPSPTLQKIKHAWMLERCAKGHAFADGTLDTSMGLVTEYAEGKEPLLQVRLAEQLANGRTDTICRAAAGVPAAASNPWLGAQDRPDPAAEADTAALNFQAVRGALPVVDIASKAFNEVSSLAGSPVLFGVDSTDDSFLTAIGRKSGVVVHGAKLVSFEHPVRSWHIVGALFDTVIALCFAWVVHGFWKRYVVFRRRDRGQQPQRATGERSGMSALWTGLFLVLFGLLVGFFVLASMQLFSWGIAVAPLLIALSMLVDGFIGGPIEQLQHLVDAPQEHRPEWVEEHWRPVTMLLGALLVGIVGCAAAGVAASAIAGWLFVAVLVAYGLGTATMLVLMRFAPARAVVGKEAAELAATFEALGAAGRTSWQRVGAFAALARAALFWGVLAWGAFLLLHH